MRRFVKAFAFKRDNSDSSKQSHDSPSYNSTADAHAANKKNRKPPHSLSIKSHTSISASIQVPVMSPLTSSPSTPQLSVSGDHHHSSSASSSAGSVDLNLQTPDDEHGGILQSPVKNKPWNMWVINKKSSTLTSRDRRLKEMGGSLSKEWPAPPSISSQDVVPNDLSTLFQPISKGKTKPEAVDDIADETSTGSENDASLVIIDQMHYTGIPRSIPTSSASVRQNMRILIKNKLLPLPVSYPLASYPTAPLYPRSCNRSANLQRKRSIRFNLFQKRLLQRLDETTYDLMSILPLGTNRKPVLNSPPLSASPYDTEWPSKTLQVTSCSVGIRRWISRPCFEDTCILYLPSQGDIVSQQVTGTSLGVAALEYSEALDIMAGPDYFASDITTEPVSVTAATSIAPAVIQVNSESVPSDQPAPSSSILSPSILMRNPATIPSPLRNGVSTVMSEKAQKELPNTETAPLSTLTRRGVRFAEDEDDALPLHIVRMQRKREEKARFLRSEQRRRELEPQKALQVTEKERRRKEAEVMEREREMQEKRAKEDEKKQRALLEQVAAARQRRESHRAGVINGSRGALPASSSSTSLRDSEHVTTPREARHRSGSMYTTSPAPRRGVATPPHDSSSGSSRPPSLVGHSKVNIGDKGGTVGPTSTSSMHAFSSSEDVHRGQSSRRNSTMAPGTQVRPSGGRTASYPMWMNNVFVPPVPPIPLYMTPVDPTSATDMPLLPPIPPFMMQQYSRRSSRHSSPGHSNSSSSRLGTSINSSSERIDHISHTSSRLGYSLPPSPSSSPRSSGFIAPPSPRRSSVSNVEHLRSGVPPKSMRSNYHQMTSTSHPEAQFSSKGSGGRLHIASQPQVQLPSPWTALPTQTGIVPVAMPMAPMRQENQLRNVNNVRKQTFIV
ncbi:hypothetical protein AX17_000985 [Amanita inopinata Kibby_2008]|nr:hypothetical protein AX17_000985 [Amanita inopinata Kibby_2008]